MTKLERVDEVVLEDGHVYVDLENEDGVVTKRLCEIVAEAWIENPNAYTNIRHKDGDKTNNHPDNLEWIP